MSTDSFWEPTIRYFSPYIQQTPLSEKLLSKPPFRYLHDLISEFSRATGFGHGLYNEEESNALNVKDKDSKIAWLSKIIQLAELASGTTIKVKPAKIIAGLDPADTNAFLQVLAKQAKVNTDDLVEKCGGKRPKKEDPKTVEEKQKPDGSKEHLESLGSRTELKKQAIEGKEEEKGNSESEEVHLSKTKENEDPKKISSLKNERSSSSSSSSSSLSKPLSSTRSPSPTKNTDVKLKPAESTLSTTSSSKQKSSSTSKAKPSPSSSSKTPLTASSSNRPDSSSKSKPSSSSSSSSSSSASSPSTSTKKPTSTASVSSASSIATKQEKIDSLENNETSNLQEKHTMDTGSIPSNTVPTSTEPPMPKKKTSISHSIAPLTKAPSVQLTESVTSPMEVEFSGDIKEDKEDVRPVTFKKRPATARKPPPKSKTDTTESNVGPSSLSSTSSTLGTGVNLPTLLDDPLDEDMFIIADGNTSLPTHPGSPSSTAISSMTASTTSTTVSSTTSPSATLPISVVPLNSSTLATPIPLSTLPSTFDPSMSMSKNDITHLRDQIQSLIRSVHPLGKLLDYAQEDMEMMNKELEQWKLASKEYLNLLSVETDITKEKIAPMDEELKKIDESIQLELEKLAQVKARVFLNEQTMEKLVTQWILPAP